MLVHISSLGGVAAVGSKDIMAVSRVWGHSVTGLRRLTLLRHVSFSGTWSQPAFEPLVQQSPVYSRPSVRFIAQAATVEDSSELQQRRGLRLSRAERYALVENFVVRHKESHKGKWPTVNTIVKEIGGSRVIVKDIVEELEKNSKEVHSGEDTESNAFAISQGGSGVEELADESIDDEEDEEDPWGVDALHPPEDTKATKSESQSSVSGKTVVIGDETPSRAEASASKTGEADSDPGLWRRLRNFGQQGSQNEARQGHNLVSEDDDYYSEDEADDDDESEEEVEQTSDMYRTFKEATQQNGLETHIKSGGTRASSDTSPADNYGMFIRFLPLTATEADLRSSFQDCGEIVRAQAMVPKGSGLKFTYGFVDFTTPEALSLALKKDKVYIKGSAILTEACSGSRRISDPRPASARKQVPEHLRKSETYRNSDARAANGARTSPVNRIKTQTGTENGSKSSTNGSYLVAVEGLPYPMPISAVEKMLSAHGGISRSELAREEGGTYSAHVEFKTEEARDSALVSSRVYLGGRWCRITTGEPILTTVVRLSNVGNASEGSILQRCAKLGRVDNIVHRKEGVVDVYYHPTERRNMRKILDRLGDVNADFKRWHANLAPKCTLEEMRNSAEIQDWVEVQKDRLLDSLAGAMKSMLIDLEDLRELVDAERSDLSNSGKSKNLSRSPGKPNWS